MSADIKQDSLGKLLLSQNQTEFAVFPLNLASLVLNILHVKLREAA